MLKKTEYIRSLIVIFIIITVLSNTVLAASDHGKRFEWPYIYYIGMTIKGWSTKEGDVTDVSLMDAKNADPNEFKVYENPYSVSKRLVPYFTVDEDYYDLCKKSIKTYLDAVGIEESSLEDWPEKEYPAAVGYRVDGKYITIVDYPLLTARYIFGENGDEIYDVRIDAAGTKIEVYVSIAAAGPDTTAEEKAKSFLSNEWFDAAKRLAGIDSIEYTLKAVKLETRQDYSTTYAEISVFDTKRHDSRYSAPERIRFVDCRKYSRDNCFSFILYLEEPKAANVRVTGRIGYEEAKKRLKENGWYALANGYDLSDVSEEDIYACDIIYSDVTDMRYLVPCYRFYVRSDVDHYLEFYVPAVEFEEKNPYTGDAGVYAVASVSLLSLIAAQYVYKKSKRV